jgi:hypothetical protein
MGALGRYAPVDTGLERDIHEVATLGGSGEDQQAETERDELGKHRQDLRYNILEMTNMMAAIPPEVCIEM